MRLLNIETFEFHEFAADNTPPYVVASHRWLPSGEETTYKDVLKRRNSYKAGYQKVQAFCSAVRWYNESFRCNPPLQWLWIDTCCIDKRSSAEVSLSINSMCKWYRRAALCFAYLADVSPRLTEGLGSEQTVEYFQESEWFSRGWTLQELLAPEVVLFFDRHWTLSGRKDGHPFVPNCKNCHQILPCSGCTNFELYTHYNVPSWNKFMSRITGIPPDVLADFDKRHSCSIDARLGWIANRKTTEPEDIVYCMLGVFDVHLPLLYGEGAERASRRLWEAIHKAILEPGFAQFSPGNGVSHRTGWFGDIIRTGRPRPQALSGDGCYNPNVTDRVTSGEDDIRPDSALHRDESMNFPHHQEVDVEGLPHPQATRRTSARITRRISASDRDLWSSGGPWGKGPPPSGDPANPYGYQREPLDPESPREGERGYEGVSLSTDGQHWLTSRDIVGFSTYKTTSPTGTRFAWDPQAKQRYIVRADEGSENTGSAREMAASGDHGMEKEKSSDVFAAH